MKAKIIIPLLIVAALVLVLVFPGAEKPVSEPSLSPSRSLPPPTHTSAQAYAGSESGEAASAVSPPVSTPAPSAINSPATPAEDARSDVERWRDALAVSAHPGDQILSSLLEEDPDKREWLMLQALEKDPYNPLLNYAFAEYCLTDQASSQCGSQYLDMLGTMDADNGAIKDLMAIQAYRNGDFQSALEALMAANHSAVTDGYRWQHALMTGDALLRQGMEKNGQFIDRVLNPGDKPGGVRMGQLYQMCQDQRTDSDWQSACASRGISMSQNGSSYASQSFGYGLAMSAVDDPGPLQQQYGQAQHQRQQHHTALTRQLQDHIINNPDWRMSDQQWQRFQDVYANQGETAAYIYLLEQTSH